MADKPCCPNCRSIRLCHTGALWMCPRCGLMITKHALAAETGGPRLAADAAPTDGPDGQASD